jgi:tetratricopeptide (TPR) repeat protein
LLDTVDAEEREIYHRWVAQGIEYVYPHDPAQSRSLAYHWGKAGDVLRESQFAIQAGEQSLQHNDYKEAIRHFERALSVIPQDDQAAYAKLLILLGDSNSTLGNLTRAKKYLQRGITLAREVNAHSSVAMGLRALGNVAWNQGVYEEAQYFYGESLALYRKVGDPRGIAKSLDRVGYAKSSLGHFEEAKHYDLEGLSIYWALQDRFGIANSLISVGVDEYMQGRLEDAKRRFEESLLIAEEIGDRRGIARALCNMGTVEIYASHYDNALRYLQDSLNLARDMDDQPLLAVGLVKTGFAYAGLGDFAAADRYFHETIREALQIDLHHFTILEAVIGIAGLWLEEGRLTDAAAYLGLALGHPATDEEVRQTARPILSRIQELMNHPELEDIMGAGQNLNLRRVVREILGEV